MTMLNRLRKFEKRNPEIVFSWKDTQTEAEGWVVINSLRGGAAGGGTRMRKGLDLKEVISLAKTMEIKFAVSGPEIGGAKSGINFDPKDPRKNEVLKRWFKAIYPLLKNYYGTGGDLNVDELKEVRPITSSFGILHHQEGIVNGFFKPDEKERELILHQLNEGVSQLIKTSELTPDLNQPYRVSDLTTGYGVAESVIHYYDLWGGKSKNKKVVLQGFGNVGGAAAFYLAQSGLKIVGITDHEGGVVNQGGFTTEEIVKLLKNRDGNLIKSETKISGEKINKELRKLELDIFVPAAGSRLVSKDLIDSMIENGLELICCGANVPFNDEEIFFGPTGLYADNSISVIPDFIANSGMARTFAYLMKKGVDISDREIFRDISDTIRFTLERVVDFRPQKKQIAQNAMEIILNSLE